MFGADRNRLQLWSSLNRFFQLIRVTCKATLALLIRSIGLCMLVDPLSCFILNRDLVELVGTSRRLTANYSR